MFVFIKEGLVLPAKILLLAAWTLSAPLKRRPRLKSAL